MGVFLASREWNILAIRECFSRSVENYLEVLVLFFFVCCLVVFGFLLLLFEKAFRNDVTGVFFTGHEVTCDPGA